MAEIPQRNLSADFIRNTALREHYIQKGYVVLQQVASNEAINHILEGHKKIVSLPEYQHASSFQTTHAFGSTAHQIGALAVNAASALIFPDLLDTSKSNFDLGGSILIKNSGSFLGAHQGSPLVDEYQHTTTFAWIPTVDVIKDNGVFYVLEGSHRWAAWQRTGRLDNWPLLKFQKLLWTKMRPVSVRKGDVLLFDSALIHASAENTTGSARIAANVCITAADAQLVQYVLMPDTPKGMIEKYLVNRAYWEKGDYQGRPVGYDAILEPLIYPTKLNQGMVQSLLQKYQHVETVG